MNASLRPRNPLGDHLPLSVHQNRGSGVIEAFSASDPNPAQKESILMTLLMTDIVGSTSKLALLGDRRWAELLDQHDEIARECVREFGGYMINTTGDGFITAFSVPTCAVNCAKKIRSEILPLSLSIRASVHVGECKRRGTDISGLTVHIAARILGYASRGQILTSKTVKDIAIGTDLNLQHAGTPRLKGVPGDWPLYEVQN